MVAPIRPERNLPAPRSPAVTPSSLRLPGPSQPGTAGVIVPPAPRGQPRRVVADSLRPVRPSARLGRGEGGRAAAALLGLTPFLAAAFGLVLVVHAAAPMLAEAVVAASIPAQEARPGAGPSIAPAGSGTVPPGPRIAP